MSQQSNKPKIHRNQFTPAEDALLIIAVNRYGMNWQSVSKIMDNRTPRQCRDRWNHYLSPMNNHCEWTASEDQALLFFFNQIGPKWGKLASMFPGRTCVSTRNRCCRLLRISKTQVESHVGSSPASSPIEPAPAAPVATLPPPEAEQKPKFLIPSITTLLANLENPLYAY